MPKIVFGHHCYLGSRSKVGIKVMGQGHRSRSKSRRTAVDIRDLALPSAAKSHYQSKVFVCAFVIRGRESIIALMLSIGF